MDQLDLLTYPSAPGFKEPTTSREAAVAMKPKAATLRAGVMACLRANPDGLTADECAEKMGESVLSVRPRVTELKEIGAIVATGTKRENASGLMAKVWCIR